MNKFVDAAVDGAYTALTALSGYMVGQNGIVLPSKAMTLFAAILGAIGALNQLRGINKQPPPVGVALPPGIKPLVFFGALLLFPATLDAQPAQNVITRVDVSVTVAATQLCPANASRIDCSCTNNDPAIAIRVGDANVSANRGQRVTAGGTFKETAVSAVFGAAESGTPTVSCTDQSR